MSHKKTWVMLDEFTRMFSYGDTELGKVKSNPWKKNHWTIEPSFSVGCVTTSKITSVSYGSLGQASDALVDLWASQVAYESSWDDSFDGEEYDSYEKWINSVLSGFHNYCGGSD